MATLQLSRNVYYPGNAIPFSIFSAQPQTVNSCFVNLTVDCWQKWTTRHSRTTGSGKRRRTTHYTRTHTKTTILVNMNIPVQGGMCGPSQPLQGSFILDPSSIPSIDHGNCKLRYSLRANLNNGSVVSAPAPFSVLVPMTITQWQQPSARAESRQEKVTCCCCCPRGELKVNVRMSKTVIALDRDQLEVECDLDASQSEATINKVVFTLMCNGVIHGVHGLRNASFATVAGTTQSDGGCEAKQQRTVKGTLKLNPLAPPSFSSPIVNMQYSILVQFDVDWGDNIQISFQNLLIAHSVDLGNQFQMNQFQNFAPMMNGAMYQPPPPPPGGGPAGFEASPSDFFTALPPIQFEQLPADCEDGQDDNSPGAGDNIPPPPGGYGQNNLMQPMM